MAELIICAIVWFYLILGIIIASTFAALNAGTNGTGQWSPLDWLLTVFLWFPYCVKVFFKLFGPIFLALIFHPFRRR